MSSAATDSNKRKLSKSATHLLCIKEDCFDEEVANDYLSIYKGNGKSLAILLDPDEVGELKARIQAQNNEVFVVYVFSLGGDLFDEEFQEFGNRVSVRPIPQSLLNSYNHVMRILNRKS